MLEFDIQPQQKTNLKSLPLLRFDGDSRHQRVLNMKVSGIDGLHVVTRWANERIRCTRTNDLEVGADDRPFGFTEYRVPNNHEGNTTVFIQ